jgi:hypothetical protein
MTFVAGVYQSKCSLINAREIKGYEVMALRIIDNHKFIGYIVTPQIITCNM